MRIEPAPRNDSEYFEAMCKMVFASGMNWKVVAGKWDGLRPCFADFDVEAVAAFTDGDVAALLANSAVIRHEGKIRAIIYNANVFLEIKEEAGSFGQYLRGLPSNDEGALSSAISGRFKFLGKSTAARYLYAVGIDMPSVAACIADRSGG